METVAHICRNLSILCLDVVAALPREISVGGTPILGIDVYLEVRSVMNARRYAALIMLSNSTSRENVIIPQQNYWLVLL